MQCEISFYNTFSLTQESLGCMFALESGHWIITTRLLADASFSSSISCYVCGQQDVSRERIFICAIFCLQDDTWQKQGKWKLRKLKKRPAKSACLSAGSWVFLLGFLACSSYSDVAALLLICFRKTNISGQRPWSSLVCLFRG